MIKWLTFIADIQKVAKCGTLVFWPSNSSGVYVCLSGWFIFVNLPVSIF